MKAATVVAVLLGLAIVMPGSAFENLLILMINFFSDEAEHAGNIPLKNAKQTTDGP